MMGDYISRDAAMPDGFCVGVSCQDCPFCDDSIKGGCKVARFIDAIPAADVVEVVRCRDCLYFTKTGQCDRWADGTAMFYDDYCSRAAPKDGGQDDV